MLCLKKELLLKILIILKTFSKRRACKDIVFTQKILNGL